MTVPESPPADLLRQAILSDSLGMFVRKETCLILSKINFPHLGFQFADELTCSPGKTLDFEWIKKKKKNLSREDN